MYFGLRTQLDFNQEVWMNKPEKRYLMLENLLESKPLIFFEDPDTSTEENETVSAYNFHINAVNSNSENEVSDECND